MYQTSMYSHVYEKRFNRVFKVSSFNNSGTWTINLEIFFASSDSNLYNSIATAIDPDASSSCIAKLPTYLHVLRGIRKSSGHTQTYLVQSFNFTKNNTVIFSKYNSIGNSQKIRLLDTVCGK